MIAEQTLMKFGLINDDSKLKLKEVFKNYIKLKEVHIDVYPESPLTNSVMPFMLLLRTIENKATVLNDGERLIIKKNDTYFMNVLFSEIKECCYKSFDECFEFIINIQNIYYRIIVFN